MDNRYWFSPAGGICPHSDYFTRWLIFGAGESLTLRQTQKDHSARTCSTTATTDFLASSLGKPCSNNKSYFVY